MGKIFSTSSASIVSAAMKVSNDYINRINRSEKVPAIKIPAVDFSKDTIVIWVPGTNDRKVPKEFVQHINKNFSNSTVVLSDYIATWNFSVSIPHGVLTLSALLDYIKKNKKHNTKIFIAGHSQGSLVAGEVLSQKKYLDLIERAALFNHPGVSRYHYEGASQVSEFNNKYDISTFELVKSDEEKEKTLRAVSSFMQGDITKGLYLLKVGVTNPLDTIWLGISSLRLLPIPLFKGIPAFHDIQDSDYQKGVSYLKSGLAKSL